MRGRNSELQHLVTGFLACIADCAKRIGGHLSTAFRLFQDVIEFMDAMNAEDKEDKEDIQILYKAGIASILGCLGARAQAWAQAWAQPAKLVHNLAIKSMARRCSGRCQDFTSLQHVSFQFTCCTWALMSDTPTTDSCPQIMSFKCGCMELSFPNVHCSKAFADLIIRKSRAGECLDCSWGQAGCDSILGQRLRWATEEAFSSQVF